MSSPETDNKLPPLETWQAVTLRMTAFLSPDASVGKQSWWSQLVGSDPESIGSQPKLKQQSEAGDYQSGALVLQIQPIRIDWLYAAKEMLNDEPSIQFATLGAFTDQSNQFRALMKHWLTLPDCPPLDRLAFGAHLLQPTENASESYRRLALYTKLPIDVEHSSDFLYRINYRRDSVYIPQLAINRLSTWTRLARITTTIAPLSSVHNAITDVACSLELDINTTPEIRPLERERLSDLFSELSDLGREIAEKGVTQ